MDKPKVFYKWSCGHNVEITYPSLFDPAEVLLEQPKCPTDGNIYCEDFYPCLKCKENNEEKTTLTK